MRSRFRIAALCLVFLCFGLAYLVYADVPNRLPPRGTVPNPGTQQQELANITFPAPYNTFEFVVTCAACHGGTVDQQAAHFGNWAGSSMASAARDPIFRANQIAVNNAVKAAIGEDGAGNICFRCHSPNGWYSGRFDPKLNGEANATNMIHSIVLSTDDEGILCEACHRTIGNVTMKRSDLDPNDSVWNMLGGISDWPHAGAAYVDQAGTPTIAPGNPYGDTSLQINDGMTYIGKYSGSVDVHFSDVPLEGTGYTGQTYAIYPPGWNGPKTPVPPGMPQFNSKGEEIAYAADGSIPLHFEAPIGPPLSQATGNYDYMAQAISLEHPTVGDRPTPPLVPIPEVPKGNKFLRSSEFCGSCHDLTVPILNHGMPEQRTYTEWKFSNFGANNVRCQDCHMPTKKHEYSDDAPVALNPDPVVSGWFPYAKDRNPKGGTAFHKFAGANRVLPMAMKLLYPEPDLEVIGAPTGNDPRVFPGMLSTRDPMYDRNQRNSEIMLKEAISLEVLQGPTYANGRWSLQVKVTNTSGHRIPSGYPDGRRFWIALNVTDANGTPVYQSGLYDDASATLFTEQSADGTKVPFRRAQTNIIDAASNSVMAYERVTGTCTDVDGNPIFPSPTAGTPAACAASPALTNNFILFDNRILPAGFDYTQLRSAGVKFWNYDPATMVPSEEPNRYPGGQNWDVVTYVFDAPADAVLTVRAEVYWQTHSREFMEHLRVQDTSTVRPEGPPNILDPNYPLNPTYLSDEINLAGINEELAEDPAFPDTTLSDNWGGIAFAAWYKTGKGAPFLVTSVQTGLTAPAQVQNVLVHPELDANGAVVPGTGVVNAQTGLVEPYSQKVSWDPVEGAEGYVVWIRYGLDDATADWDKLAIVPASAPLVNNRHELLNTALNLNKTYAYKVQPFNGAGSGPESGTVTGKTPWDLPLPPENLKFQSSTASSITMNWYDPNDNEDGHIVWRQNVPPTGPFVEVGRPLSQVGFGGVEFTDTTAAPATCYNYVVEAFNASGNSGWNANGPVQMCTQGPPSAPTSLTATVINSGRVDLSWLAAKGAVDIYRIERSSDGTDFSFLASVAGSVLAHSDLTTLESTTYWYRVLAVNAAGASPASNVVQVTTPPLVAAPTNLVATPSAPSPNPPTVTLIWTDNSNNESVFAIERATAGGAFTQIGTVGPNGTTYSDTTVAPKMTYSYRVRAFNGAIPSAYSNTVQVVTPGEIPEAPQGLRIVAVSTTAIRIAWLDAANNELGFYVERSPDGVNWSRVATLRVNSRLYTSTRLSRRTTYHFRVQAYNADGVSAYSNVVSATTR